MNKNLIIEPNAKATVSNFEISFKKFVNDTIMVEDLSKSVAGFQFSLKRRRNHIVILTYLPCMMLLLISFIGFFIPVTMIPGRMALLVTIFLMLVNISSSEKANGPNVIPKNEIKRKQYRVTLRLIYRLKQ